MLMPLQYIPPGAVHPMHPGHPGAMGGPGGGPPGGPSIRSNSLSISESGAPGSDASFGRCGHGSLALRLTPPVSYGPGPIAALSMAKALRAMMAEANFLILAAHQQHDKSVDL